mmetsp:Transcript_25046/g.82532  ORF Transcript_25046/g.82532 Transcript_25046/m.82532 type:complete len:416 (-) Transcript_25046:700-1947(-)
MRKHRPEGRAGAVEEGDAAAAAAARLAHAGVGRRDPAHQDKVLVPRPQRRVRPRLLLRLRAAARPRGAQAGQRVVRARRPDAVRVQGGRLARRARHADQPAAGQGRLAAGDDGAPRPLAPPRAQPRARLPGGPADRVHRGPRLPHRERQDQHRHRPARLLHARVPGHDHDDPRQGVEGALCPHRAARVPHHRVLVARHPVLHVQALRGDRARHARLPQGKVAGKLPKHGLLDLHQVHHCRAARVRRALPLAARVEGPGGPRLWLLPDGGLQPLLPHRQAGEAARRLPRGAAAARPPLGAALRHPLQPAARPPRGDRDAAGVRLPPRRDPAVRARLGRRGGLYARVPPLRRRAADRAVVRRAPRRHRGGLRRPRRADRRVRLLGQHANLQVQLALCPRDVALRRRNQGALPHHHLH